MINVLLITTTIYTKESNFNLQRLFKSITFGKSLNVKHLLLFQGVEGDVDISLPEFVVPMFIDKVVSLSKARNIMISKVLKNIDDYDFIAFPDDDCWYPHNNFEKIVTLFATNNLDFLVTKYRFKEHYDLVKPLVEQNYNFFKYIEFSSSITIFLTGKVFSNIGTFDERLGVGAKYEGGEDLDFSIRAYIQSSRTMFIDKYLMAHKDRNISNKVKYFEGSLFVFKKNCLKSPLVFISLIRKILVGFYYVFNKKLKLKTLFHIFKKVSLNE